MSHFIDILEFFPSPFFLFFFIPMFTSKTDILPRCHCSYFSIRHIFITFIVHCKRLQATRAV